MIIYFTAGGKYFPVNESLKLDATTTHALPDAKSSQDDSVVDLEQFDVGGSAF